ncbi:hypothetical protein WOLCODRAFT_164972 [Wolfiporia cocos MD-104 SS10]|uniref:F-box domain-containing protein n=1 Tax=Wolfiporia cocos (strain MD-104) TaxID=742152 RepID=A0A2H3JPU7_WOLCO|nr:hypothetical protein WOLCODRAFT_164972 [Wolfiporia cocos MD-104 SS10]
MEGQPTAPCITEDSAFDVEGRILRDIEWLPLAPPWEPQLSLLSLLSRRHRVLPQFSSETVASRVPIEIWYKILAQLRWEPEMLGITEEVCKGWYPISHRLKGRGVFKNFGSMEDVCLYARYIKTIPRSRRLARLIILRASIAEQGKESSLAHLGAFAAMFAGRQLPRLSGLSISGGEWIMGTIPHTVFLHLSAFHSTTRLSLSSIVLPSITVLLRLVCALDSLEKLSVRNLWLLDRRVPPASRRWAPSPNFKQLELWNWPDELVS